MICKNCGSEIDDNAWECPYCTIDITQEQRDAARAEKARASQQASEAAVQMAYQQAPPPVQQTPPPVQQAPPPVQQAQPAYRQPVYQQTDYQHPIYRQQAQPVYQQPVYQQPAALQKAEAGLVVLSALVPLAGVILGAVELHNGKKRAGKTYLFTGLGVWLGSILLTVLAYVAIILLAISLD